MGTGPFAKFFVKRVGELNTYFTHLNLQVRVEIRPGEAPDRRSNTSSYCSTNGTETAISNRPVPTSGSTPNEAPRLEPNVASNTLVYRSTVGDSSMQPR